MERDRFIDSLRAMAVVAVVLGHWSATSVVWEAGRIAGESALSIVSELHYLTWLLQVMPLLFFVGGFSNARSLRLHHDDYLSYLRTRLTRLLQPTVAFIVIWLLLGLAGELLPLPQPNLLERGADIAALPFWFVGVYVVVVALAPSMYRLHERWRWRVPAALVVGAVVVDVAVYGFGVEAVGFANYAFVWLIPHQFGFFYGDGILDPVRPGVLAGAAGAGLAGLVILTRWAGYPVSLIMVPGEDRWNSDPPSLALVAVAVWLISLALLARPALRRVWKEAGWVERINRVPLSMYLWHISVLPVAVGVLYPLGFPRDQVGSVGWWLWRPVWLASLAASLMLVLLVVRRFEVHPPPRPVQIESAARPIGPASFGVVLVAVALLGFGVTGFNGITANYGEGLLGFTLNPLFCTVHLILGLAVLGSVFRSDPAASVVVSAALILGLIGLIGRETGMELLATNGATATLDLVLGGLGALAAAFTTRSLAAMTRTQHDAAMAGLHSSRPCQTEPMNTQRVLIIGASRGIGLGLACRYLTDGWTVHATTRTPEDPGELGGLTGDLHLHAFDVRADPGELVAAVGDLDVLIHNAGVGRGAPRDVMMAVNAEAPIRVVQAFLDGGVLKPGGKVAIMTSQVGARRGRTESLGDYGDSKAALNDEFRKRASDWGALGILAVVVHPGWVRTDMGGESAPLSIEESAEGMAALIAAMGPEHHGRFWTWDARQHEW